MGVWVGGCVCGWVPPAHPATYPSTIKLMQIRQTMAGWLSGLVAGWLVGWLAGWVAGGVWVGLNGWVDGHVNDWLDWRVSKRNAPIQHRTSTREGRGESILQRHLGEKTLSIQKSIRVFKLNTIVLIIINHCFLKGKCFNPRPNLHTTQERRKRLISHKVVSTRMFSIAFWLISHTLCLFQAPRGPHQQ